VNPVQIMIVDDHPLFRRGIRWSLEAERDLRVVGEAGDGHEAIRNADTLIPDVMLVDINLPGMNGLEVARILKRRHPRASIIVLTMHEDDEQLFSAIRAGAAAYCTKDIDSSDLIDIIRRVARGEYVSFPGSHVRLRPCRRGSRDRLRGPRGPSLSDNPLPRGCHLS
jgi:DNA-binding NarL/FixJ family response regulator